MRGNSRYRVHRYKIKFWASNSKAGKFEGPKFTSGLEQIQPESMLKQEFLSEELPLTQIWEEIGINNPKQHL